jgi:hypothetical protein
MRPIQIHRNLAPLDTLIDPRKCKIHRSWKKKGVCDLCALAEERALKQYKLERGLSTEGPTIKKI